MWDDEVDVVCTDAGAAGLADAISAVDGGAEVSVAAAGCTDRATPGLCRQLVRPARR